MAIITFSEAQDLNLFDGSSNVNDTDIHWMLLDTTNGDISSTTQIVEQGVGLNITNGEGVLTVTTPGDYIVILQSSTLGFLGSYYLTAV